MDSWSLEIALVTRRLREDPEVVWGPRGRRGARRPLRPYRNPEVSSLDPEIFDWNPKVLEVVMTPMRLRLHRGSSFFLNLSLEP
ncbi:hypothetical protein DY000_02052845 [Brassica cretica]|uniref:Uncharacterized protein n=1 Tax=Brassica cretica TaxID=69181 RepID=A0ABQ7ALH6_BRACR|nr:hypothetical protein DY000_02052845 [Brassica cretica]